jgi:hypothetical protein
MGEESHGLRLLLLVLERLKAGGDRARTEIATIMDRGAVALWDGQHSLGQVTAARAMALAVEKARAHGDAMHGVQSWVALPDGMDVGVAAAVFLSVLGRLCELAKSHHPEYTDGDTATLMLTVLRRALWLDRREVTA